jgi:hypothetical protein
MSDDDFGFHLHLVFREHEWFLRSLYHEKRAQPIIQNRKTVDRQEDDENLPAHRDLVQRVSL